MLVKAAYYASSITFLGENYAPLLKIMLFEKIANQSKKIAFLIKSHSSPIFHNAVNFGVAKAGNSKLDFLAKIIEFIFWVLSHFRCYRDTKTSKFFLRLWYYS